MIPTMVLIGLLLGRWWKSALIAATLSWPVLLLAESVIATPGEIVGAAVLAALNGAVGVGIHHLVLAQARLARRDRPPTAAR